MLNQRPSWVLDGVDLGLEVLEVGPGYGAATEVLRARAGRLTCVEVDRALATRLASQMAGHNVTVLCEDATRMAKAVLNGRGDELVDLARTNLFR